MNLEKLDCTGCNICKYSATDRITEKSIVFWYNQCDEDGFAYSLNSTGLPDNHEIRSYPMISGHEELENLIYKHLKDVDKIECSCESNND